MTDIQAALGLAPAAPARRPSRSAGAAIVAAYDRGLRATSTRSQLPVARPDVGHALAPLSSIRLRPERLRDRPRRGSSRSSTARNIGTSACTSSPSTCTPTTATATASRPGDFPVAARRLRADALAAAEPGMQDEDVTHVIEAVRDVLARRAALTASAGGRAPRLARRRRRRDFRIPLLLGCAPRGSTSPAWARAARRPFASGRHPLLRLRARAGPLAAGRPARPRPARAPAAPAAARHRARLRHQARPARAPRRARRRRRGLHAHDRGAGPPVRARRPRGAHGPRGLRGALSAGGGGLRPDRLPERGRSARVPRARACSGAARTRSCAARASMPTRCAPPRPTPQAWPRSAASSARSTAAWC